MSTEKIKYYGIGTKFLVEYQHDGITEKQKCILAKMIDDDFLFQVITIDGYHSGTVEGYISRQFDKTNQHANLCTWDFIKSELKKRVFPHIQKIELSE